MPKRKPAPVPGTQPTAQWEAESEPHVRAHHDRLQKWGIPEDYWPFYHGSDSSAADWDDPLWAISAVEFMRIFIPMLPGRWVLARTQSNVHYMSETEQALGMAMNRIGNVASLYLSPDEYDRLREGYAAVQAGFRAFFKTSQEIRLAGGDSAHELNNLLGQWAQVDRVNPQLAEVLLATNKANPFRAQSIEDLADDLGILSRLLPKLMQTLKSNQGGKGGQPEKPESCSKSSFRYGMLVKWFKNHPAKPAIMVAFALLIVAVLVGLCMPPWRVYAWAGAALGLVFVILSRL